MLSDIENVTVTVSAHKLDSYRSVELRARRQWARLLDERDDQRCDGGLQLVASEPDTDLVDHLVYQFDGTAIASARAT